MINKLKQQQPVVYQVLSNCLKGNKLSHAIILSGSKSSIKLNTAYLIAQSIVCESDDYFGCEQCEACQKITNNSYADLKYIDGSNTSIKKDDIINLQLSFHKTGIEKSGKKVYIINCAENMTIEACNSLLKFLEEPSSENMFAIFIVDNLQQVLPTIVSRCQIISFKPNDRQLCIEEAMSLNVDLFDANIISNFIKDSDKILEVSESEAYQNAICILKEFNDNIYMLERVLVSFQTNYLTNKDIAKDTVANFVNVFCSYMDDYLTGNILLNDTYKNLNEYLKKNEEHFSLLYSALLKVEPKIYKSFDLNLVVDQMFYELQEVIK